MIKLSKLGKLSTELQKYYTRKGNKIVFANGMNLNQLAMEMWERLEYSGVDPSVISKVLSGERIFTATQLEIFSITLKLENSQKELLKESLSKDVLEKYKLEYPESGIADEQTLLLIELGLKSAKDFMKKGQPKYTMSYIELLADVITNIPKNKSQKNSERIDVVLADLYIEYMDCLYSVVSEKDMFKRAQYPLEVIYKIGKKYKNERIINSYYSLLASTYYIGRNPQKAIFCVYKLMDTDKLDDFQKMTSLRAALISCGQKGRADLVKSNYRKLINFSNEWSESYKASIYDGVARSLFDTGDLRKADLYLEKLLLIQQNMKPDDDYYITRNIQALRTELMFSLKKKGFRTKNYMIRKCGELIQLCQLGGYDRVYKYASRYLNEI
jgi:hypothetical protein